LGCYLARFASADINTDIRHVCIFASPLRESERISWAAPSRSADGLYVCVRATEPRLVPPSRADSARRRALAIDATLAVAVTA